MDKGSNYYQTFLSGDDSGMEALIREYSDGLTLYINTIVHDIHTAEDLMLETFIKLGVRRPADRGHSSFKTWLYTIGRNIALDYLRKNKTVQVPLEEIGELPDDAQTTLSSLITRERDEVVHRCMRKLGFTYYQALWLYYFEGFSTREIAALTGKTVHATQVRISRARQSLKEYLIKEGFDYEDL